MVLVAVLMPLVVVLGAGSAGAATATITSAGPLTAVGVSDQLNCSVNHTGDTSGEFYGGTACGTFIVVDGTMYFSPASIPAGQPSATPFTPVSQTGPTGTGTDADPFKIVTTVTAGATGVGITQTDSYVTGLESYRTDVVVTNTSGTAKSVRVYRAADCYLQSSDTGFGAVDTATGAVACTTGLDAGSRIEQWFPLTSGSSYLESDYATVWSTIASMQPFPNTCQCTSSIDNGAGLSWDVSVPAAGSSTISSLITFSPLGRLPLSLTKTADAGSVTAGGADGYTITASNPNPVAVPLETLVDDLPAGFAYIPGSTTGATTANPTVAGQELTWTGVSVPANGDASLHFGVTASSTPGTYTNEASTTATDYTVAPTGPTAPVTVAGVVNPLVIALTPASATNPVGTSHTVTATATRGGTPQNGVPVSFSVISGPNAGTTGSATTGASGTASFTYTGGPTAGTDTIRASATDGETTVNSNDVTKTWTPVVTGQLAITSTSEPPVVTAGGQSLTTVTATNTGTIGLTGVNVTVTRQAGTRLSSITPSQGTCDAPVGNAVTCHLGAIAGGANATIKAVIRVPSAVPPGGTVTTSSTATSTQTGAVAPASSSVQIAAATPGQASGFVPPGGTLATGTTATPQDNTIISFTLPNSGPGAPISLLAENDATLRFCGGARCSGKTAFVSPFAGYNDPNQPASLKITWDRTVAGRGIFSKLYVQKAPGGPVVTVPDCAARPRFDSHHRELHGWWGWFIWWLLHLHDHFGPHSGIASPSPCVNARSIDRTGDVTFEVLLLSGDPKFARR